MPIPVFNINFFVNRHHKHYQSIVFDDGFVFKVNDIDQFYEAFGYARAIRSEGILPEVYFWQTFISPSASHHFECLQTLLLNYLNNVSGEFRQKYADEYEKLIGTCDFAARRPNFLCNLCKGQSARTAPP